MIKAKMEIQKRVGKYANSEVMFDNKKHLESYIGWMSKNGLKVVGIELEYVFNDTENLLLEAVKEIPADNPIVEKIIDHLQKLKDSLK